MSQLERESAALCVEDVCKVYADGTQGLRGLSLRVPAGCFFGLLGPNGSGKSTLIGMVSGLVRAPAGRIFVFGCDVVDQAPRARLQVGVAPQEVHLDRFLTVRDLLIYHGRYFGMAQTEAGQRSDELLDAFDLMAKADTTPNRLSGGMRRRLLIARALVHRPQHEDTTIVLTTHYLEEAEELCERLAFIREGQLIAEGSVSELVTRYGGSGLEDAFVAAMR